MSSALCCLACRYSAKQKSCEKSLYKTDQSESICGGEQPVDLSRSNLDENIISFLYRVSVFSSAASRGFSCVFASLIMPPPSGLLLWGINFFSNISVWITPRTASSPMVNHFIIAVRRTKMPRSTPVSVFQLLCCVFSGPELHRPTSLLLPVIAPKCRLESALVTTRAHPHTHTPRPVVQLRLANRACWSGLFFLFLFFS